LSELKAKGNYQITAKRDMESGEDDRKALFETMVPVGSMLAGLSLKAARFRNIHGCSVVAIRHRNRSSTRIFRM